MYSCEVCRHAFAEKHRLLPGKIGGPYESWNVVYLCPNHHAAWHYLIDAVFSGRYGRLIKTDKRMIAYFKDDDFAAFADIFLNDVQEAYLYIVRYRCAFDELPRHVLQDIRNRFIRLINFWRE